MRYRTARVGLAAGVLALATAGCFSNGSPEARDAADVPYQADVEEGLGAAVAILVDTSGSMAERVKGDARRKDVIAREAIEAMLDTTDAFVAQRPDFPIKIGIYSFSSRVRRLLPIQGYDRAAIAAALDQLPRPGGGTAIGDAMRIARPDLYRAGVFRKYILVVTDGENTEGPRPDEVARDIWRRSQRAVQSFFVAFDTSPAKFAFLKEVGGEAFGAGTGPELRRALHGIYQGKILAEAPAAEREPARK
ncbi:MAG TPA: vWA domain-containing protein [Vicinamibacterales bacterium]|nr:vWA domain-containing protein [Vicinamibacterales bacterium]